MKMIICPSKVKVLDNLSQPVLSIDFLTQKVDAVDQQTKGTDERLDV